MEYPAHSPLIYEPSITFAECMACLVLFARIQGCSGSLRQKALHFVIRIGCWLGGLLQLLGNKTSNRDMQKNVELGQQQTNLDDGPIWMMDWPVCLLCHKLHHLLSHPPSTLVSSCYAVTGLPIVACASHTS